MGELMKLETGESEDMQPRQRRRQPLVVARQAMAAVYHAATSSL